MREHVPRELCGGLWHMTHLDRFQSIFAGGSILPEPNIPDSDRWKTSQGKDHYPYVRTLGGVSLFDFDQFDADRYRKEYPVRAWYEFVPYVPSWGCSVWIEIDRGRAASQLISGSDLVARWESDDAYGHSIMPQIEAAHLGPLPRVAFKRAFLVLEEDDQFHPLEW